eukprot:scaffold304135_cov33-Tisochrysis_lutea.AAC.2
MTSEPTALSFSAPMPFLSTTIPDPGRGTRFGSYPAGTWSGGLRAVRTSRLLGAGVAAHPIAPR